MNRVITSDLALVDGEVWPRFAVRVEGGAIAACGPRDHVARPGDAVVDLGRRAMIPGTVNAHSHSFQSLLRGFGGHRTVSVHAAPHSLHGASPAMIRAAVASAREAGTRWHIHLAEEKYQVEEARTRHGATPLRALEQLGVLGDDTIAIHGCWF